MTAQIAENLTIDGRLCAMCTEPLNDYFALSGMHPKFEVSCTALWRGYVGHWEIAQDRLYLLRIDAQYPDGRDATLNDFFPGFEGRVFAHWYSGTLRIPEGHLLEYVHGGYASEFERDRLIRIERGVVVDTQVRTNGVATDAEAGAEGDELIAEYRPFAMTVFPPTPRENDE